MRTKAWRGREGRKGGKEQDDEISAGLREGRAEAVQAIRSRVRKVLSFRGFGIPREDRRDLEQEVLMQVWQVVNRPDFEAGKSLRGLVDVIASRRCIDWLRKAQVTVELDSLLRASNADPLQETMAKERSQMAYAALAELDKPCRELIFLHAGLNKSYGEISRVLGKKEGALRVQMFRCVRKLRRTIIRLQDRNPSPGNELEARL